MESQLPNPVDICKRKSGENCQCQNPPKQECNQQQCPYWTEWSEWTDCSKSCGGGDRSKVRQCTVPLSARSSLPCPGPVNASETCNVNPCPGMSFYLSFTLDKGDIVDYHIGDHTFILRDFYVKAPCRTETNR